MFYDINKTKTWWEERSRALDALVRYMSPGGLEISLMKIQKYAFEWSFQESLHVCGVISRQSFQSEIQVVAPFINSYQKEAQCGWDSFFFFFLTLETKWTIDNVLFWLFLLRTTNIYMNPKQEDVVHIVKVLLQQSQSLDHWDMMDKVGRQAGNITSMG